MAETDRDLYELARGGLKETPADEAFIARLNREHLQRTEDLVSRMNAAREKAFPEPENPLDMEDVDGIPVTDPATGKMALLQRGTDEYQRYLDEHREKIELHRQWETAPINAEYVALRRELQQAQEEYTEKLYAYFERIKNAPSIGTRAATQYIAPTDAVSNRVFSGQLSSAPEFVKISGSGAKKPVKSSVSVDFEAIEGDTSIAGRKHLDRYTQNVYQAIMALWYAGNSYITIGMIYSAMTGAKNAKLNEKQAGMITRSIKTLMQATVNISASEEHTLRGYGAVKASYYGNLITAKFVTVNVKGKRTDGAIQIFTTPILYEYASAKNQIATGDIALLNAPINKTPENIILIDYLRRRVDMMPNLQTKNKIRYAAVYEALDVSGNDNTAKIRKRRIREYIKKTLDYWTERGHIQAYTEYNKEGKAYAEGIQITPAGERKEIPQEGE